MRDLEPPVGVHVVGADGVRLELEAVYDGVEGANVRWSVLVPSEHVLDILGGRAHVGVDVLPGQTTLALDLGQSEG